MKKNNLTRRPMYSRGRVVIGLTGPAAAGKSLALSFFAEEGAFCVSADAVSAKALTAPACYNKILARFGQKILTNGSLDKERLAAEVFSAPAKRKWLERLLHPEILKRIYSLIKKSGNKISVVEAPLLFEAGLEDCFTFTVCIAAGEKETRARAAGRGWSRARYAASSAAQLSAEEKRSRADIVLDNNGTPEALRAKVQCLCRFLRAAGDK